MVTKTVICEDKEAQENNFCIYSGQSYLAAEYLVVAAVEQVWGEKHMRKTAGADGRKRGRNGGENTFDTYVVMTGPKRVIYRCLLRAFHFSFQLLKNKKLVSRNIFMFHD